MLAIRRNFLWICEAAALGGERAFTVGKVVYKSTPPTASVDDDFDLASLDFILDPRGSYKFIRFILASHCNSQTVGSGSCHSFPLFQTK